MLKRNSGALFWTPSEGLVFPAFVLWSVERREVGKNCIIASLTDRAELRPRPMGWRGGRFSDFCVQKPHLGSLLTLPISSPRLLLEKGWVGSGSVFICSNCHTPFWHTRSPETQLEKHWDRVYVCHWGMWVCCSSVIISKFGRAFILWWKLSKKNFPRHSIQST